jgi:hypothetical protein
MLIVVVVKQVETVDFDEQECSCQTCPDFLRIRLCSEEGKDLQDKKERRSAAVLIYQIPNIPMSRCERGAQGEDGDGGGSEESKRLAR